MDDNEIYLKLSEKIDKLCDKLDTKFDNIDTKLQNHEVRIVVLEQRAPDEKKDWKADIITLLVKAVVIGAVSIASLVGASGILANIFGGGAKNDTTGNGKNALLGARPAPIVCQVR
jgi:hypothetical protein